MLCIFNVCNSVFKHHFSYTFTLSTTAVFLYSDIAIDNVHMFNSDENMNHT